MEIGRDQGKMTIGSSPFDIGKTPPATRNSTKCDLARVQEPHLFRMSRNEDFEVGGAFQNMGPFTSTKREPAKTDPSIFKAPVAQWIERLFPKQKVVGSTPTWRE
ncbi:unnamed protein product [Dovyalis caffra]|uniref:Uncharacterized protein n=1 Tax=Dovyalis caffra TaxID=77055 RepID=A0AAV1SUY5_9ROSI|nr:unnamed protein product [Dovyalis caffra]